MKIRLTGTPDEVDKATDKLQRCFRVVDLSQPYPQRGRTGLVNVYAEVRLS